VRKRFRRRKDAMPPIAILHLGRSRRFLVYPSVEGRGVPPLQVLEADVADGVLGRALRAALDQDPETASREDDALERALAAAGIDDEEIDRTPQVSVGLRDRQIWLQGLKSGRGLFEPPERVREPLSDEELGRRTRAVLESLGVPLTLPEGPRGVPFGYKTAWLAVRGGDPKAVADALGLEERRAAGWEEGIEQTDVDDRGVFVTPPTGGWVLAVGAPLGSAPPDAAALSRTLGTEVQYFGTHRVSDWATWVLARDGETLRCFELAGDVGQASAYGEPTDIERELGFDWALPAGSDLAAGDEWPDEETVMQVAGAWSVDPQTLDLVETESDTGTFGRLPQA
jgi:hypothetical protein